MLTKTDIANLALHRVGAQRIMDLDEEGSKGARVMRDLYEPALRELGCLAEWQCLKDRATLGRLAPAFGWAYAYQLPVTFIRLVKLNGTEYRGEPQDDHEIEGLTLLTDAEEAKIEFVAFKEDANQFDALFVKALVAKMAAEAAVPLRQDEALAVRLMQEFETLALPKARTRTAGERRAKRFDPAKESNFVTSRWSSTNG